MCEDEIWRLEFYGWTVSDLQLWQICDIKKVKVDQIYVPCLAAHSGPVFQYEYVKIEIAWTDILSFITR